MGKMYVIDGDKLTALGNSIRSKTGSTAKMTVDQMKTAVDGFSSGGGGSTSATWQPLLEDLAFTGEVYYNVDLTTYNEVLISIYVEYNQTTVTVDISNEGSDIGGPHLIYNANIDMQYIQVYIKKNDWYFNTVDGFEFNIPGDFAFDDRVVIECQATNGTQNYELSIYVR